ncbi:adenosylcobinamide-GDP ribazoletransferase [Nonomuraea sp. CA-141351]|uniref:adenosylcobinamide-GDP ribazoletransferase n=1 Tax=Nonomuraea sp. CA-141351 TaxID=3239996 RepID=UPI003D8B48D8
MRLWEGLRLAIGTLSVFPVRVERVDREVAGHAMVLAPAVGLALGLVAGLPLFLPGPRLLGAALAVGLLAVLTRGLHLDGLADLADGLGSGKPAAQALDIMKKSDIGPFGVMTLVLTLVIQVVAAAYAGFAAFVMACVAGRLALVWACRAGVPAARADGLGAMVAGTVRRPAAWLVTLLALLGAAVLGLGVLPDHEPATWAPSFAVPGDGTGTERFDTWLDDSDAPVSVDVAVSPSPSVPFTYDMIVLPLGLLTGMGTALLLLRHARRRLGGITGDVLGALVEAATATALVVCAILG